MRRLGSVLCCLALAGCLASDGSPYRTLSDDPARIINRCPGEEEAGVSIDSWIVVSFDRPLDPATVSIRTVVLGSGRELIRGRVLCDSGSLRYVPFSPLQPMTRYDLYLTPDLHDAYGIPVVEENLRASFTTGNPGFVICR